MPRFVFLFGPLMHGGVETMMLRVANYLVGQGRTAEIFAKPGGDLEGLFDRRVVIRHYTGARDLTEQTKTLKLDAQTPVVLVTFDSDSAAYGLRMARSIGSISPVRYITGVFHPTVNFRAGVPFDRRWLNNVLVRIHLEDSIFFMNSECRDAHAGWLGRSLVRCPVIPLPVDAPEYRWTSNKGDILRVVSVGRLVDFKAYNLGAPKMLRILGERGVDATWDIYGYGPLESEIRRLAQTEGVADRLRLHGKLEYQSYYDVVLQHDVFVGMGTAALEAAMAGLPTVLAAVSDETHSHGFMHEVPFGNVGESIPGAPLWQISEMLQTYAEADTAERSRYSETGRAAVAGYAIAAFITAVETLASGGQYRRPSLLAGSWAAFFISATDGWLRKHLLGHGIKRRLLALVGRH